MTLLALLVSASLAQDTGGMDAHGFQLASHDGDPRDPLTIFRPGAFTQGDFYVALLGEWAESPLIQVTQGSAGGDPTKRVALDDLATGNVGIGVAVHDRVRLDVAFPMYFVSKGIDGAYSGPAPGDVRGSVTVIPIRPEYVIGGGGLGLGITAIVDAPTGTPERFLGNEGLSGGGQITATYEQEKFTGSGGIGTQFNPKLLLGDASNPVSLNPDQFVFSASAGYLASWNTGFTLEAHKAVALTASKQAGTGSPAEILLSMTTRLPSGVNVTVGGAVGVSQGVGAATYRGFLGIGYGKVEPPRARDTDAIASFEATDKCPDEPETKNGWKDDDGCADALGQIAIRVAYQGQDMSGAEVEVKGPDTDTTQTSTNKPIAFTAVPGTQWSAKATVEADCLAGAAQATASDQSAEMVVDLKPVLDATVRYQITGPAGAPLTIAESTETPRAVWHSDHPTCIPSDVIQIGAQGDGEHPIGHGHHTVVVDVPGYKTGTLDVDVPAGGVAVVALALDPSLVVMEKKSIKILDKIHFETAKAIIKPDSFDLLNQVAQVINENPDVGRVQIEGHTDNQGADKYNLDLSQKRADSVKAYLVSQGVPAERLVAIGFGETRPIDTNDTDAGRAMNRRVEFNLIDQPDEPPTVTTPDGTAPAIIPPPPPTP